MFVQEIRQRSRILAELPTGLTSTFTNVMRTYYFLKKKLTVSLKKGSLLFCFIPCFFFVDIRTAVFILENGDAAEVKTSASMNPLIWHVF